MILLGFDEESSLEVWISLCVGAQRMCLCLQCATFYTHKINKNIHNSIVTLSSYKVRNMNTNIGI